MENDWDLPFRSKRLVYGRVRARRWLLSMIRLKAKNEGISAESNQFFSLASNRVPASDEAVGVCEGVGRCFEKIGAWSA